MANSIPEDMHVVETEAQLDPNLEVQAILADATKVNRFVHPVRMIIAGNYYFIYLSYFCRNPD